ncbi:signal peptidase I [Candidatus Dojkabacteria bacterium]|uniref:Signal peptidase I n=1 Tax=Candidatus Dojkabacteria bacterium TaxID=2099670 RepID=A0A955L9I3_9BACT|nr:signal peptidase I [Candidatus Dojkabacteria bacterium]
MSENPFLHSLPRTKKGVGGFFMDALQAIVIVLALFVVSYLFLVIPNQVDGQSMEPNFHDNELLFTNKIIQIIGDKEFMKERNYNYRRGDVVIFQKPGHDDFIKRVIALPGDEIMIQSGKIYINNTEIHEMYIPDSPQWRTNTYSFISEGETKVVPIGHYFLMGDNRNNSKDSRFSDIGFVSREHIKGRVFLRYWPFEDFGFIGAGEIEYVT